MTAAYMRLVTYQKRGGIAIRDNAIVQGLIENISINKVLNKLEIKYIFKGLQAYKYCDYFIAIDSN